MKTKRMYVYSATVIGLIFLIALFFKIGTITQFYANTIFHMTDIWVFIPAAAIAFVFLNNKHYWLIAAGSAVVASIAIQLFVVKSGFPLGVIFPRAVAFFAIVYVMNFARVMLNK